MRRRRPGVLLDQQYLAKNPLSRLVNRRLANRGW
jgi:hypothetical protein